MRKLALIFSLLIWTSYVSAALPFVDSQGDKLPSLAPMLEQVKSGVVNIATYSKRNALNNPLLNDPFFRYFFQLPEPQPNAPQKRQTSAGSGVIVDAKNGTIITNYHVIKDSDEIQVGLLDGRSIKAELLGADPEADIAVLKIKADNLTEIKISDSEDLRVGDFVVAIGNPFGLGQTVTTGVVSALGRTGLGIEGYENFIQTDASINPGNSGGALVNLKGELVGINTAIISPAGGNVGIGFAIPTSMAHVSLEQILEHGEVKRGQLGIVIQDLTPDLKSAFKLDNDQTGVLVSSVAEDSEADKAGIKPSDIITKINGKETKSASQLRNLIGMRKIGEKLNVTLLRDGKEKTLHAKVGEPQEIASSNSSLHELLDGATFENNGQGEGVVVAGLKPNSNAAYSGLRQGDIIIGANRKKVANLNDLKRALQEDDKQILLHVRRGYHTLFLVIK